MISKLNPTLLQKHSNLFIYLFIFCYCKTSGHRIFRSILPVGALPECSTTSLIGKRHFFDGSCLVRSKCKKASNTFLFVYLYFSSFAYYYGEGGISQFGMSFILASGSIQFTGAYYSNSRKNIRFQHFYF